MPQAAQRLGVSAESVRRLADSGKIVGIRPMGPTGHRKIVGVSIDRYLESLVEDAGPLLATKYDHSDSCEVDFDSIVSRALAKPTT